MVMVLFYQRSHGSQREAPTIDEPMPDIAGLQPDPPGPPAPPQGPTPPSPKAPHTFPKGMGMPGNPPGAFPKGLGMPQPKAQPVPYAHYPVVNPTLVPPEDIPDIPILDEDDIPDLEMESEDEQLMPLPPEYYGIHTPPSRDRSRSRDDSQSQPSTPVMETDESEYEDIASEDFVYAMRDDLVLDEVDNWWSIASLLILYKYLRC